MDAILAGGPRDGTLFDAEGAALVELDIDGLRHRYIVTNQRHDDHTVYTYDGVIDPKGAQPGTETALPRNP
ncbi:hypothetical protein WEI85_39580 [Actinomycetes bacterium KLBMP 9797]